MILHFRSPKSVSLCWNQNVTRLCYFWRFGNLFLCLFFFLGLWSSSTLKASGIAALDPISTLHLWSYYLLWFWSSGLYLQFSSVVQSCLTLCDPMDWSIPGLPVHHQLLEFIQTLSVESVMASNHLILCHPLLLPLSILPSIRVFSSESVLLFRWPKYWSFSFNISPSNEYSGLISFGWIGWLSLQFKGLSTVFFSIPGQKPQFFSTQLSL